MDARPVQMCLHKFAPEDKKNFTRLVKELRTLGSDKELSFAAGASQRYFYR